MENEMFVAALNDLKSCKELLETQSSINAEIADRICELECDLIYKQEHVSMLTREAAYWMNYSACRDAMLRKTVEKLSKAVDTQKFDELPSVIMDIAPVILSGV